VLGCMISRFIARPVGFYFLRSGRFNLLFHRININAFFDAQLRAQGAARRLFGLFCGNQAGVFELIAEGSKGFFVF
ncbi:hypothetical protein N8275_11480, partial [Pseudomonadales bacterium]|nr:hypothetical protein [Pseudomonadales bacterium]